MKMPCRLCGQSADSGDLPPGTEFQCQNCGQLLRAPFEDETFSIPHARVLVRPARGRWWSTKRGLAVVLLGLLLGGGIYLFGSSVLESEKADYHRWSDASEKWLKLGKMRGDLDILLLDTADWGIQDREETVSSFVSLVASTTGDAKGRDGQVPALQALSWMDWQIANQEKIKDALWTTMRANEIRDAQLLWPVGIGLILAAALVLIGLVGLIVALMRND